MSVSIRILDLTQCFGRWLQTSDGCMVGGAESTSLELPSLKWRLIRLLKMPASALSTLMRPNRLKQSAAVYSK